MGQRLLSNIRGAAVCVKVVVKIVQGSGVFSTGPDLAALIADDDIDHNADQDERKDRYQQPQPPAAVPSLFALTLLALLSAVLSATLRGTEMS